MGRGLRGQSGALGRGLWSGGGAVFCSRAKSSLRGTLLQSSAVLDPVSFCLTGLSSTLFPAPGSEREIINK